MKSFVYISHIFIRGDIAKKVGGEYHMHAYFLKSRQRKLSFDTKLDISSIAGNSEIERKVGKFNTHLYGTLV